MKYFLLTEEAFAVIGDRLYTAERSNGSEKKLCILDRCYDLEVSEKISSLERKLLEENKDRVQNILNSRINRAQENLQKEKQQLINLKQQYDTLQTAGVEKFVLVDVFDDYYNRQSSNEVSKESNFDSVVPEVPGMPSVDSLYDQASAMNMLAGDLGFLSIGKNCYKLEYKKNSDLKNGYVKLGKRIYNLRKWKSLKEVRDLYTSKLEQKIKLYGDKHKDRIKNEALKLQEHNKKIHEQIKKYSCVGKSRTDGVLSFNDLGNNRYEIRHYIEPFIIEKTFNNKKNYYAFSACEISFEIKVQKNQIRIENEPRVHKSYLPYTHPFVFQSPRAGEICYDHYKWKQKKNVEFKKLYPMNKSTARKISNVIRKGRYSLERGYLDEGLTPVRHPDRLNCKIGNTRQEALNYARGNGIPESRIINNG
ncbi:MAG: hypothetical protein ACOCUH_03360 [Bacteriovoracia bacterium]